MSERLVVLVRHASAAPGAVDLDRPLTDAGRGVAAALGGWLAGAGLFPQRTVISPSRRTQQTWDEISVRLSLTLPPLVDERVYQNTVDALLAVIRETPPDGTTFMLIGHNPSMHDLATMLDDGRGAAALRERLARGFPTGAAAAFAMHDSIAIAQAGSGTLTDFSAGDS